MLRRNRKDLSWYNPVQFSQGKSLNWSVCDVGGLTLTLRNLKVFAAQVDIDIEKFTLAEVDRCIAPRLTSSDTGCTTKLLALMDGIPCTKTEKKTWLQAVSLSNLAWDKLKFKTHGKHKFMVEINAIASKLTKICTQTQKRAFYVAVLL